ncbi:patatin-like phospholipase family protein [Lusitaniella coriacea LEGE 07157]|uniref:Patatin-like phospholipase family protein n=1 Tax=Lusitaniella coriacea LEGE 07157 TaxID=945747 RepID=A0A8J7DU58_9CYAN|nr:patatin-like phospholipase family protein [Lusitaniella coriacea]MBE9115131.1 patatin-like phospholipase family protein [Lusitaniella coriacea LEGE 07157]
MPQKLAITISGAVSLGSHDAGVLYEVLRAIAQHNKATSKEAEKIEIDVITGASAGAMTACILAQKLLFDRDSLEGGEGGEGGEYDNDLYRPWVEEADIVKLLKFQKGDDPNKSIFSSSAIAQIGYKYLLKRYEDGNLVQNPHPAAAESIHLGMTMSNLNGFDFEQKVTDYRQLKNPDAKSFVYTTHRDWFSTEIKTSDDRKQFWEKIEQIGRSSGAFPFAFQVLEIERDKREEVYRNVKNLPDSPKFNYTDGGIFDNDPLGMAKRLVNRIDIHPNDFENRYYLYISPGPKKSSSNVNFNSENANFINTARALSGAIFTQARFQDWIEINQINASIDRFHQQAIDLKEILTKSSCQRDYFDKVMTELLTILYQEEKDPSPREDDPYSRRGKSQKSDSERLRKQFSNEYDEIHDKTLADTWIKTVQVLEKAAGLGDYDLMKIYAITSEDENLIGEGLSAFVGFLSKEFRRFDYDSGRINAIKSLEELQRLHQSNKSQNLIKVKSQSI